MDQGGQIMNVEHDKTGTLRAQMKGHVPIVLAHGQANAEILCDKCPTLNCTHEQPIVFNAQGSHHQGLSIGSLPPTYGADFAVRRLTPIECERLQGFPDNWTRIPYRGKPAEQCPDSPRYKACGNSMAVPVMRWIGKRIEKVEKGLAK
jgi:site-specific DNA-cytosine methylase